MVVSAVDELVAGDRPTVGTIAGVEACGGRVGQDVVRQDAIVGTVGMNVHLRVQRRTRIGDSCWAHAEDIGVD
ncbi:hypothetical protein Pla22_28860 [Rubripirellula amarantea]|uniref:Uncharacterized protein n=1 Tax=Rubripirellula amarantea TaxID=2527999 RepID=A0A5C5WH82_9BACT|nr:hypothetical protein Pla22_28860 [Rubripirellula amarantea]